jgi:hypothetical protein
MADLSEETLTIVFDSQRRLLQVSESQPTATSATLELLAQSITQTQAIADAGEASNREIKRNWNLP